MLNDIQHLITAAAPNGEQIAGINCRPLTLQTFALLELTENQILTATETKMADVLGFIYLHSAPEKEIAEAVSAYIAGNKSRILQETLKLPTIPLNEIGKIAQSIREMIEKAMSSQVQLEDSDAKSLGESQGRE